MRELILLAVLLAAAPAGAAQVSVKEYPIDIHTRSPVGVPPSVDQGQKDFSGGPVYVSPTVPSTKTIEIVCDAPCSVLYGPTIDGAVRNVVDPIPAGIHMMIDLGSTGRSIWIKAP